MVSRPAVTNHGVHCGKILSGQQLSGGFKPTRTVQFTHRVLVCRIDGKGPNLTDHASIRCTLLARLGTAQRKTGTSDGGH